MRRQRQKQIFTPPKKAPSQEKKAAIEFRQQLGKQVQKVANVAEKIDELFEEFDLDHNQKISLNELKQGLLRWGVKLNKDNSELLVKSFPAAENANKEQFREIISFFIKIRNNFSEHDQDLSNTINNKELVGFLSGFDYGFDSGFMFKFLNFFDTDKSGELDWQEIVELMLYVHYLHHMFRAEDQSKDGILAPSELQSLLRALDFNVTVTEISIFLERQRDKLGEMNFEKFVELLIDMKENLETIRKEAAIKRKQERKPRVTENVVRKLPITSEYEKNLAAHNAKVEEILKQCRATGKKFEDSEFSTADDFVFPKRKEALKVIKSWKRIRDFGPEAELFKDGIDQGDVKQGALGDCWFLSSLCVLAAHGVDTIKSLFMEAYPEEGVIQCKFFKDNEWVFVVTDDRIPCGANGRPAFACCRDKNELWVPVLEKCYAKVHGSFEAIESGSIADGLVDLTGESSETLDIKKEDTLWNMLKFAIDEGYVMGCAASAPGASVEMETPLGILMLHAYGILKVYEIQGFRLCKIRNPWGRYEWKGKWSDGSKEWTPSLMKELNVTFEDDGTFFMEFSDFCKQFNKLYVLRILTDEIGTQWKRYEFKSEWAGPSAGGCPNFDTWSKNPQYHVRVPETSKVFVSLRQPCMRLKSKYKPTYPKALGFCVFVKGDSSPDPKVRRGPTDLVCLSPFFAGREISVEFEAKANVDYVIVPSHFKPGEENPFFIFIYTINPKAHVALCVSSGASQSTQGKESAPQQGAQATPSAGGGGGGGGPKTEITLEAAWIKGKTAGGCINEPTWKQNPQFILELPTESKIAVTLKQTQKVDNKFLHCGFIILKADPQKKSKIQIVDNIHQSQYINSQSNTSDVSLSAGAYNIITTTFHPNLENTFTLSVAHDCDPKTTKFFLLTPQNDWAVQKASGAWGPGKDGGCSNNKATWMQNPQFLLQVDQKVSAKVVLEVNGPKSAVGFYLFTSNDGVKVVKMVGASAFMQGQKLVSVVKDYDLEPGKYILLAATFDPAKHSNFDVIVYADKPLSLRAI